jgi:hypothetical protein
MSRLPDQGTGRNISGRIRSKSRREASGTATAVANLIPRGILTSLRLLTLLFGHGASLAHQHIGFADLVDDLCGWVSLLWYFPGLLVTILGNINLDRVSRVTSFRYFLGTSQ